MVISGKILDRVKIKPEEWSLFVILFLHSFFLGIFIAFYFVPANSVFLEHFNYKALPYAYMAAGVVGYIVTTIYSAIQKRHSSFYLFFGAIVFMIILTLLPAIMREQLNEKWLSFFVFVWAWPFISLVGTETGGLSVCHLNLMQVKRLYGLINMGGVLSGFIAYLIMPMSISFAGHVYNQLYIAVIGAIISLFFLFVLKVKFPLGFKKQELTNAEETGISDTRKGGRKYINLIYISAIFSVVGIYIADYGFLSDIKTQHELFPTTEKVSRFMAIIFAALKLGELIISYFSNRIISKKGVGFGLLALPIASFILIIAAAISGIFWGATSIVLLIFLVTFKLSERILRRGLDDPAFNILYQPLPKEQKLAIQPRLRWSFPNISIARALVASLIK